MNQITKKCAELKRIEANSAEIIRQQEQMLDQRSQSLQKQEFALEQDIAKFVEAQKAERWRQNEQAVAFALQTLPFWKRWNLRAVRDRAAQIKTVVYAEPETGAGHEQ